MVIAWAVVFGLLTFVALTNLLLMPRPKGEADLNYICLIPARNEADKIANLVKALIEEGAVVAVLDDESEDDTAALARKAGAQVVRGASLPEGWVGKNWACHQLAQVAAEVSPAAWWLFLDADVEVKPGGLRRLAAWLGGISLNVPVATGFLQAKTGRFPEALVTNWIWQMLLMTNPFGLVALTKTGHNRFLNGQCIAWRASRYFELRPHEVVKGELLEDVMMGRWLAHQGTPVAVANLSGELAVRMYQNAGEAWRGVLKNAGSVAGSRVGSWLLATSWLVPVALAGVIVPTIGAWAALSLVPPVLAHLTVRRNGGFGLLYPLDTLIAVIAIVASSRLETRQWKGRVYRDPE